MALGRRLAGSQLPVANRTRRRPPTDPSGRARTPHAGRAEASAYPWADPPPPADLAHKSHEEAVGRARTRDGEGEELRRNV